MAYTDYVSYIDTDSNYFQLYQWLIDNGVDMQKWESLSLDTKVDYIKRISQEVENCVNEQSFEITQKQHYNSQVDNFKINFEREKIASSGLFVTKKRYALYTLMDGNKKVEEMYIKGLEIIRSDSPEICKPKIKRVLEMILQNYPDAEIKKYINKCKEELKSCKPEEIAENKGVNNLTKYIDNDYSYIKGTPHQVKGVAHLRLLVDRLNLKSEVELPLEGTKAKVVYLKPNKYKIDSLSFVKWHKAFDRVVEIDMKKMIENNFLKKISSLLTVIGKEDLMVESVDISNIFC